MPTRRTFLSATAVTAAALGCRAVFPSNVFAASGIDPGTVAALNRDRRPTQWGMALPGIVAGFTAAGRQLALTFDA